MLAMMFAALLAAAPAEETHWYGWQTLATDAGSIAFAAATAAHGAADTPSTVLGITSAAFYFAGGPLVHLAHGRGKEALSDFLLRAGIPLGAGLLGAAIVGGSSSRSASDDCGSCSAMVGFLLGAGLGGIGASALDAAVLAREPVAPARLQLSPAVGTMTSRDGEKHAAYGVAMRF